MKKLEIARELFKNTSNKLMQVFIESYISNIEELNNKENQNEQLLRFNNCMEYLGEVNFNIVGWKLFEMPIFYSHCFYNDKLQQAFDLAVWDIGTVEVRYLKDANEYKAESIEEAIEKYDKRDYINGGVDMNANTLQRPCTPSETLKNALEEMKLMRKGEIKKQSFWDMMKELDEDDE